MSPSWEQHRKWAEAIELDIQPVFDSGTLKWAAVATFYSAMHYVQAYLVANGLSSVDNHRDRNQWVALESKLKPIYPSYKRLYDISWSCRYEGRDPTRQFVSSLIQQDFSSVKQCVLPLLPRAPA